MPQVVGVVVLLWKGLVGSVAMASDVAGSGHPSEGNGATHYSCSDVVSAMG